MRAAEASVNRLDDRGAQNSVGYFARRRLLDLNESHPAYDNQQECACYQSVEAQRAAREVDRWRVTPKN